MSKIRLTNLGIVLTERCNLNCIHCMRGCSLAHDMDIKTMQNIFKQVDFVNNLTICGGEPMIDEDLFTSLIDTIISSQFLLGSLSFITNGTCYNDTIASQLLRLDEYINHLFKDNYRSCNVALSFDEYHIEQIKEHPLSEQYFHNMAKLLSSPYYCGLVDINEIYDSGNAKKLDIPKMAIEAYSQYYYEKKGKLDHGPLLSILSDGTISECDGEFTYLREHFNYGNINTDALENIIKKRAVKCYTKVGFNYHVNTSQKNFHKI